MCRVGIACSRRLIDRLQPHEAHQAPHPVAAHRNTIPPQLADHLTAAVKRMLHEQLIDAPHQRQVIGALTLGRVIERRPADRQNLALSAQAQAGVIARNHCLALPPAHRLSPLAKKSRSTVN